MEQNQCFGQGYEITQGRLVTIWLSSAQCTCLGGLYENEAVWLYLSPLWLLRQLKTRRLEWAFSGQPKATKQQSYIPQVTSRGMSRRTALIRFSAFLLSKTTTQANANDMPPQLPTALRNPALEPSDVTSF
eukprot:4455359-Amphidinium_carterae.1